MRAAPSTTAVQARIHAHERSVPAEQRKADGVHYTPAALARFLVEQAISALGYVPQQICDPTCGAGSFLLAAADALADRGVAVQEIVEQRLFGGEIDPQAGALAQDSLRAWAEQRIGRVAGSRLRPQIAIGDMLLRTPESWVGRNPAGWDLVIGNPPFLSQLATRTSRSSAVREAVQQRFGDIGVYADSASLFLLGALDMVCQGGVVVMVQPQSFLATRDTAAVRSSLLGSAKLRGIWQAKLNSLRLLCGSVPLCCNAQEPETPSPPSQPSRFRSGGAASPKTLATPSSLWSNSLFLGTPGVRSLRVRMACHR